MKRYLKTTFYFNHNITKQNLTTVLQQLEKSLPQPARFKNVVHKPCMKGAAVYHCKVL